ncbi:MAG: hypothetical protein EA353_00580 [Puniceicoccaceae bacterium]|nr:MAG: hypothetical protein EA353_00580 [Puniceicoccaceae bacterium]
MNVRPSIRVAIVDFGESAHVAHGLLDYIREDYRIEITNSTDADYVFHGCMGYDVLKYTGVRIFVTGEMVSPNFNISDYALSFDAMDFGDRNQWFPLIKLYKEAYAYLRQAREPLEPLMLEKTGFCAYVMSNAKNSAPERVEIVERLQAYQPVSLGGRWRNNTGGPVDDKIAFQRRHKFVIAFENQSYPGYLTEKFAEAALSGAIPIYWGDPHVADYFNPKAFINCHDFSDLQAVADHVAEVDQDDARYAQYMREPWVREGVEPDLLSDANVVKFLKQIFDAPQDQAYRRNRGRWGQKYEKQLRRMWCHPLGHAFERIRRRLREKT